VGWVRKDNQAEAWKVLSLRFKVNGIFRDMEMVPVHALRVHDETVALEAGGETKWKILRRMKAESGAEFRKVGK
jgi:hypothetical protein